METIGPIVDFKAVRVQSGGTSVTWRDVESDLALTFTLERSNDGAKTWTTVDAFANTKTLAQWDSVDLRWKVTDAAGAPGTMYRLTADDGLATRRAFIGLAPEASRCVVMGYIVPLAGTTLDVDDRKVIIEYLGDPTVVLSGGVGVYDNKGAVSGVMHVARAALDGYWQAELLRGARVKVVIPAIDFVRVTEVPDSEGPVNITDLVVLDDFPAPAYFRSPSNRRK